MKTNNKFHRLIFIGVLLTHSFIFSQDIDSLLDVGLNAFLKDDYNKATRIYNEIVLKDSINYIALNNLGYIYDEMNNYNMAIKYYKILKNIYPDSSGAYFGLGSALYKTGKKMEAYTEFINVIKLDELWGKRTVINFFSTEYLTVSEAPLNDLEFLYSIGPIDCSIIKELSMRYWNEKRFLKSIIFYVKQLFCITKI